MKRLQKYRKKNLISILIVLIILIGYYFNSNNKQKNSQEIFTIQEVKKGEISEKVLVTGRVESANYLPITTSVNGIVKKIYVKEGDRVFKGQKIMEIQLSNDGEIDYQNALISYNNAKIALEKAKTELRYKESDFLNNKYSFERLRDKNINSTEKEIELKTAENNFKSANDYLSIQKQSIKLAEITVYKNYLTLQAQSPVIVAPDSGVISNILFVEGMDITNSLSERSSVSVASIKNKGKSISSFSVSELDINKISVGQKVDLKLSSIDGKSFTGEVVGTDKVGSITNNLAQYLVIIRIEEENENILPNMKIDGEIIISEKKDIVLVPSSSITKRGKNFVTLENGERKEIEIGISDGVYTEAKSGISEGEKVRVTYLPISGFINNNQNSRTPGGFFGR